MRMFSNVVCAKMGHKSNDDFVRTIQFLDYFFAVAVVLCVSCVLVCFVRTLDLVITQSRPCHVTAWFSLWLFYVKLVMSIVIQRKKKK